ncbi:MAG: hypothetical protein WBB69_14110 [Anaerolineales bacterium]
MNDQERAIDQLVDKALRDFPQEPVPERLFIGIMNQIESPILKPGLRFSWIDFFFSFLLAVIIGFFLDLIQNVTRSPYWSARIRVEILLAWQELKIFFMHNQTDLLAGTISILTLFALLFVLAGIYRRQTVLARSMLV